MDNETPVKGAWKCYLCQATGTGGSAGYQNHYKIEHLNRRTS